jgi:hypothetical protein
MSKSPGYSGNPVHDQNVANAELTRQNSCAISYGGTISQATLNSAWVTCHRSVVASGLANGIQVGLNLRALRDLGVNS